MSAPAAYPVAPGATGYAPPPAPLQADPGPPIAYMPARRGVDEEFYRRNRNIAIVGKVLTAIAPVLLIAAAASNVEAGGTIDYTTEYYALAVSAFVLGTAGRVTWAATDLKMTNRFNESGVRVRRGAAIASTVAASVSWIPYLNFAAAPATWIVGSIASGRIRDAHDASLPQPVQVAPYSMQMRRGFSAGFTLKF